MPCRCFCAAYNIDGPWLEKLAVALSRGENGRLGTPLSRNKISFEEIFRLPRLRSWNFLCHVSFGTLKRLHSCPQRLSAPAPELTDLPE
jgi:hypothetical protein